MFLTLLNLAAWLFVIGATLYGVAWLVASAADALGREIGEAIAGMEKMKPQRIDVPGVLLVAVIAVGLITAFTIN